MKRNPSARLNESLVYEILKDIFPSQNDYYQSDYKEELAELKHFGISTELELESLLQKHLNQILEIDADPVDEQSEKVYRAEYGDAEIDENLEKGFWFSLSGLLRLALDLEFGDSYKEFANARDGI